MTFVGKNSTKNILMAAGAILALVLVSCKPASNDSRSEFVFDGLTQTHTNVMVEQENHKMRLQKMAIKLLTDPNFLEEFPEYKKFNKKAFLIGLWYHDLKKVVPEAEFSRLLTSIDGTNIRKDYPEEISKRIRRALDLHNVREEGDMIRAWVKAGMDPEQIQMAFDLEEAIDKSDRYLLVKGAVSHEFNKKMTPASEWIADDEGDHRTAEQRKKPIQISKFLEDERKFNFNKAIGFFSKSNYLLLRQRLGTSFPFKTYKQIYKRTLLRSIEKLEVYEKRQAKLGVKFRNWLLRRDIKAKKVPSKARPYFSKKAVAKAFDDVREFLSRNMRALVVPAEALVLLMIHSSKANSHSSIGEDPMDYLSNVDGFLGLPVDVQYSFRQFNHPLDSAMYEYAPNAHKVMCSKPRTNGNKVVEAILEYEKDSFVYHRLYFDELATLSSMQVEPVYSMDVNPAGINKMIKVHSVQNEPFLSFPNFVDKPYHDGIPLQGVVDDIWSVQIATKKTIFKTANAINKFIPNTKFIEGLYLCSKDNGCCEQTNSLVSN